MESVRLIAVPFYDSLSIRRNWQSIKQLYPDILQYFPDYDPEYMPSRKFFWEVFASLHYGDAKRIIYNERKARYEGEAKEKAKEIVINKEILDLIQGSLYFSKKKGRALYNIKPKEYGNMPQRKRRLPEVEEREGESLETSVFNTNRPTKRSKHEDCDQAENEVINLSKKLNPFASSSSFKKTRGVEHRADSSDS